MNTAKKVVKYEDYELTVGVANAESGMYRTLLIEQAQAEEGGVMGDLKALSRRLLHTVLYPSMIAATEEWKGFDKWPISFDDYCKLPEPFVMEWEVAVFELNKHWQPKVPEPEEVIQKKQTRSTPK